MILHKPNLNNTFEAGVSFPDEKQTEAYKKYGEGSIAGRKDAIAQKILQCFQLCWETGRIGV